MFLHFCGISILSSLKRPMRVSLSISLSQSVVGAFHIFVIILVVECHVGVTAARSQNKAPPHKIKNLMGFFAEKGACAGNENAFARVQRVKQVLGFCFLRAARKRLCACAASARAEWNMRFWEAVKVNDAAIGTSRTHKHTPRNEQTAKSSEEIR